MDLATILSAFEAPFNLREAGDRLDGNWRRYDVRSRRLGPFAPNCRLCRGATALGDAPRIRVAQREKSSCRWPAYRSEDRPAVLGRDREPNSGRGPGTSVAPGEERGGRSGLLPHRPAARSVERVDVRAVPS